MNIIMMMYITVSTVVFAFAFNTFAAIREEQKQLHNTAEILNKRKDLGFIAELDKGDGVREEQFILAVLDHVGLLNFEKDVKPWQEVIWYVAFIHALYTHAYIHIGTAPIKILKFKVV